MILVPQLTMCACALDSDESFRIDYKDSRKNHQMIFDVLENMRSECGREMIQVLRIEVPHLIDIRDLNNWTLSIVLEGRALLLTRPTYSKVYTDNYDLYMGTELNPCDRTQDSQSIRVNRAKENEGWSTTEVLMWLPDDDCCTVDMTATCIMKEGIVGGKQCRQVHFNAKVESKKQGTVKLPAMVQPLVWKVRLANVEKKVLVLNEEIDTDI